MVNPTGNAQGASVSWYDRYPNKNATVLHEIPEKASTATQAAPRISNASELPINAVKGGSAVEKLKSALAPCSVPVQKICFAVMGCCSGLTAIGCAIALKIVVPVVGSLYGAFLGFFGLYIASTTMLGYDAGGRVGGLLDF